MTLLLALLGAATAQSLEEGIWAFDPIVHISGVSIQGRTVIQAVGGGMLSYRRQVSRTEHVRWISTSRASAVGLYGLTSRSWGADFRLGSFLGPRIARFQVQMGPDLFFDFYGVRGAPDYFLPPSPGIAVRNLAVYDFGKVAAIVEAAPAWLLRPERRAPGLGPFHQLSLLGAIRIRTDVLRIQVGYQRVWTSAGIQDGIVFGGGI